MTDERSLFNLLETDSERAWTALVDGYSPLILAVIGRYTPDPDARMDAYVYVLQELAHDDMRRIRRYGQGQVERPCLFTTWLKLVVRNLYFDWFRHRHGRKSIPKEIQKLDETDQQIFRKVYWEGYRPREAFEILATRFAGLSYSRFLEGLSEVDARLTGINRAKIRRDFLKAIGPMSLDVDSESAPPLEAQAAVDQQLPDEAPLRDEQRRGLAELLAGVPAEDRLILRLRFYEGMTAKQIAAAIGSRDSMSIYRRIERICAGIAREARARGLGDLFAGDHAQLADSGVPDALAVDSDEVPPGRQGGLSE